MTNSIRYDSETMYCSIGDVNRYFRQATGGRYEFDPEEDQEQTTDVYRFIEKWSAKFDRKTGQSYRNNQVIDETHDHEALYYWHSGHPINLREKDIITPLDAEKGDKLELYTGNDDWEEWVADDDREEGRNGDYWVDNDVGILYVYDLGILRPRPKFRVSYRFGNEDGYVPADVRDAIAAASAADMIQGDFYGMESPGSNKEGNANPYRSAEQWKDEFEDTCSDYKRVHFV